MSGSKKNSNRLLLQPGEKVNEFTIVKLIGQGGYGDVYEVTKEGEETTSAQEKKKSVKKETKKVHDSDESENSEEEEEEESNNSNESNNNSNESKNAEEESRDSEEPINPKEFEKDVQNCLKSRRKLAMKVEMASCPTQSLKLEQSILQSLEGSIYFPQIKGNGFKTHFRYLVMDLFGPSLSNTRRQMNDRHYTLSTTLRLGVYMLQCIKEFHNHGYVHCDIKPGNYLLQPYSPCPIVLIDYGLSRRYIDSKTNEPVPENKEAGFVGTSKYMSIQVQQGCDTCPRDDIISLCYSLVEMIGGKLPWRMQGEAQMKKILKMKKTMPLNEIFGSLPTQIETMYKYAMKLKYLDKPDYNLLFFLLNDAIEQNGIKEKDPYDWESFDQAKANELSPAVDLPKAKESVMFPNGIDRNVEIPDDLDVPEGNCCIIF